MSLKNEVQDKIETLLGEYETKSGNFSLITTHLNELLKIIDNYPTIHSYNYIPSKTKEYYEKIEEHIKNDEYVIHQKVLLVRLIQRSLKKIDEQKFNNYIYSGILNYYNATLDSLVKNNFSNNFFVLGDDKYLKVQSICNLSTIPVNPLLVDKDRISVRFLFSHNLWQFVIGIYTVIIKMRGAYPIYKFHNNQVDYNAMKYFNAEGVRKMFLSVADLLQKNKKVKGISGTSWFFDPKIKSISPELGYFYDLIIEIGGRVYKLNTNEKTVKNATFLSKKRKSLYEQGLYKPYNYVFIITRKRMIKWGKANANGNIA